MNNILSILQSEGGIDLSGDKMPKDLAGPMFTVRFDAKAKSALSSHSGVGLPELNRLEKAITNYIKDSVSKSASIASLTQGSNRVHASVLGQTRIQRKNLAEGIEQLISAVSGAKGDSKLDETGHELLNKYITAGFGKDNRGVRTLSTPELFGEKELKSLRNRLKRSYGPGAPMEEMITDKGITYYTGLVGGSSQAKVVKKAIDEELSLIDTRIGKEDYSIRQAFGSDIDIPSGYSQDIQTQTDRNELLKKAEKVMRQRATSGMPFSARRALSRSAFEKRQKIKESTLTELYSLAGIDPEAVGAMRQLGAYLVEHPLPQGEEFFSMFPELATERRKALELDTLNKKSSDTAFLERKTALQEEIKIKSIQARDDYYTTGEGAGTEYGKLYRRRKKRSEDRYNMRRAGRMGRVLRRIGVPSKAAGTIGRVFGAAGSAMIIVGAIVAGAKLIVSAVNKLADKLTNIASAANVRQHSGSAANVSADFAMFAESLKKSRSDIDLMQTAHGLAENFSSITANKDMFNKALSTSAAFLTLLPGDVIGKVVEYGAPTNINKDTEKLLTDILLPSIAATLNRQTAMGTADSIHAALLENKKSLSPFVDPSVFSAIISEIVATGSIQKTLDTINAGGNPTKILQSIVSPFAASTLVRPSTSHEQALDGMYKDLKNISETWKSLFTTLKEQFVTIFGPTLVKLQDVVNDIALSVAKQFGANIDEQLMERDALRATQMREAIPKLERDKIALDYFLLEKAKELELSDKDLEGYRKQGISYYRSTLKPGQPLDLAEIEKLAPIIDAVENQKIVDKQITFSRKQLAEYDSGKTKIGGVKALVGADEATTHYKASQAVIKDYARFLGDLQIFVNHGRGYAPNILYEGKAYDVNKDHTFQRKYTSVASEVRDNTSVLKAALSEILETAPSSILRNLQDGTGEIIIKSTPGERTVTGEFILRDEKTKEVHKATSVTIKDTGGNLQGKIGDINYSDKPSRRLYSGGR